MPEGDSAPMTAAQRTMIGRKGGLTTAARGHVNTSAAREARKRYFLTQGDPEGELPEEERQKRARAAERAYMVDLQYKASRAKAERKRAAELARQEAQLAREAAHQPKNQAS